MKKSSQFWTLLPALLIISGVLWLTFRFIIARRKKATTTGQETETIDVDPEPEPEETQPDREQRVINNYHLIRKNLPEDYPADVVALITAQAMHETGIFTSRLYKEQNNLFGMMHPELRDTLSVERRNGFATFAQPDDAVKDLLMYYQEFKLNPKTWDKQTDKHKAHAMVADLKNKGYFTDPFVNYFNGVRSHFNTVKALIQ